MKILFFDTETTGKADFRSEPDASHQPRLVQFAAIMSDDKGDELCSVNLIVRPDGFVIPESASAIHSITNEIALACGVECSIARGIFLQWWKSVDLVVAHNVQFDLFIMDGELFRKAGGRKAWGDPRDTFCTMHAMTPICKLPGNYDDFKWPKLIEAYQHAFGKPFDGAHDAMADIRATKDVYFWLKNQEVTK